MSQLQALLHEEEQISADRGYDYPSVHEHLRKQEVVDWGMLSKMESIGLSSE